VDLEQDEKGQPPVPTDRPFKLGKVHVRIYNGISHPVPEPDPLGDSIFFWKEDAEAIKNSLHTGDCILYSGSEVISGYIKKRFDTPYSHCGIVLRMPDPRPGKEGKEDVFIAEADWDDGDYLNTEKSIFGIVVNKFEYRLEHYAGNAIWHCPLTTRLTPEESKRVCDFVLDMKKGQTSYAIHKGVMMVFGLGGRAQDEEKPASVFCSELVARALKFITRIKQEFISANADPYTVSKLDCYALGPFPKVCLRYQTRVDPSRVSEAGTSELFDLLPWGGKKEDKKEEPKKDDKKEVAKVAPLPTS